MAFDSSSNSGSIVFKGQPLTLDQFAKIVELGERDGNLTMVSQYDSGLVLRDLVEALDNPEGLDIAIVEPTPTDWGTATFSRNGEEIFTGGLEGEISLVDAARILHGVGDLEVLEAVDEQCWFGSEVGGCSTFYSPHYEQHTDSVTNVSDAIDINKAIVAQDDERAAELILAPLLRSLENIKDEDVRSAVASNIYVQVGEALMSHMTPEGIEAVMNADCGLSHNN